MVSVGAGPLTGGGQVLIYNRFPIPLADGFVNGYPAGGFARHPQRETEKQKS
jgi:hypothetical protein